jgi:hypothetical protein
MANKLLAIFLFSFGIYYIISKIYKNFKDIKQSHSLPEMSQLDGR